MRPCREQIACGIISPKTTIPAVAPTIATVPDVKSSKKIVNVLFTSTFPNNNVHKRKLPCWRHGKTFFAYFFSSGSPTQKANYGGVNLVVILIHFVEVIWFIFQSVEKSLWSTGDFFEVDQNDFCDQFESGSDQCLHTDHVLCRRMGSQHEVDQNKPPNKNIAYANNVPASIRIFNCCGSSAINPKFKPENVPERHKRITRTITLIFFYSKFMVSLYFTW